MNGLKLLYGGSNKQMFTDEFAKGENNKINLKEATGIDYLFYDCLSSFTKAIVAEYSLK